MNDNNVIPINRAFINSLNTLLDSIGKNKWIGPEKFNAVFVDRKGFIKQESLPWPPPPSWVFVEKEPMPTSFFVGTDAPITGPALKRVVFLFYRQLNNETVEYRQE